MLKRCGDISWFWAPSGLVPEELGVTDAVDFPMMYEKGSALCYKARIETCQHQLIYKATVNKQVSKCEYGMHRYHTNTYND